MLLFQPNAGVTNGTTSTPHAHISGRRPVCLDHLTRHRIWDGNRTLTHPVGTALTGQ